MEAEFFKDCEALNIRKPNLITRVSEYVPEIVKYIKKIVQNKAEKREVLMHGA